MMIDIATRKEGISYLPGDEDRHPTLAIEAITDKTGKGTKVKYLVKWRGYAKKTWEPLKHLKGAMDAVQTFEKTLTAAGHKLAAATAISNLSAKAACLANARKRARERFTYVSLPKRLPW